MDTQTVPWQPGMHSRWGQLSGGVSSIPSLNFLNLLNRDRLDRQST